MELSIIEQVITTFKQCRSVAIIIPEQPSSDAMAAAIGLMLVLEKNKKRVRVVSPRIQLPPGHNFLPKSDAIREDLANLRDFIITVNIGQTKPEALRYDISGDKLQVYITPKSGFYEPQDVTTAAGTYAYDLIITLDLISLSDLGPVYRDNAEFFYHTPIINIDHHSGNNRYGHINLVDVVASSVSETVFEIIKAYNLEHLDEQVATSLLTGMISKTKVFQTQTVTPRSLAIASHLVAAGARRDEIIRNLYQTKNIPTLQLWGRALAKIQTSSDGKIIWSTLTAADLAASQARPTAAAGVLDELMINTPQAEQVCLLVEGDNDVEAFILSQRPFSKTPPDQFQLQSSQYAVGKLPKPLEVAEQQLLAALQQ